MKIQKIQLQHSNTPIYRAVIEQPKGLVCYVAEYSLIRLADKLGQPKP